MSLDNPFGGEVKIGLTPKPAAPIQPAQRVEGAPIQPPNGVGQKPQGWGRG